MNNTQKEIIFLVCRELCASRGEPPCFEVAVPCYSTDKWTPCHTCGRIAALATDAYTSLRISVQQALEALEGGLIDPGNYDHEDVCELIDRKQEAYGVLEEAMKGSKE